MALLSAFPLNRRVVTCELCCPSQHVLDSEYKALFLAMSTPQTFVEDVAALKQYHKNGWRRW